MKLDYFSNRPQIEVTNGCNMSKEQMQVFESHETKECNEEEERGQQEGGEGKRSEEREGKKQEERKMEESKEKKKQ